MLHACKGNAPVNVKEECVFVQVVKCGTSVYMRVCHHQPNLLSVYVMEAILEVLTRGAPQDVCVFVHARSRVGMDVSLVSLLQ